MRLFAELWCHLLGEKLNIQPPLSGELGALIRQLERCKAVPPHILKILEDVRRAGNSGVHVSKSASSCWRVDQPVSIERLESLANDLLELSVYLLTTTSGKTIINRGWKKPGDSDLTGLLHASLSGDSIASYQIAKVYLERLEATIESIGSEKKHILQRDVIYWAEKALLQGNTKANVLFAEAYDKKLMLLPAGKRVDDFYKLALKQDEKGVVATDYALFLQRQGRNQEARKYLELAAQSDNHIALERLIELDWDQPETLEKWVSQGICCDLKSAFQISFQHCFSAWQANTEDELATKRLRSAYIEAKARRIKGIGFYQGVFLYQGALGREQDKEQGARLVEENIGDIPTCFMLAGQAFEILNGRHEYFETMCKLFRSALAQTQCNQSKAKLKFDFAESIRYQLENKGKVEAPDCLTSLYRSAANADYQPAVMFVNSSQGKALFRAGTISHKKNVKKAVDRTKQKKARKMAKKARR